MQKSLDDKKRQMLAVMLCIATLFTSIPFSADQAYAADNDLGVGDVVHLELHHQIRYGEGDGGYSNLMKAIGIDDSLGDRYVFCTQPHMPTPEDGNYKIDKMYTADTGKAAMLRKLVYYAKGYPGWSTGKAMWFDSGEWSNDDIYGIFHVAISYVTAGYDDDMEAWGGGTVKEYMYTRNWNKMLEIVNDCKSDTKVPDAPKGFKCFYIIKEGYQNVIGGTLEYGNLKLTKESAAPEVTDGNSAYSFEGAEFGVYKNGTKVATLTTDAKGKSNLVELEAGTYTVKEDKVPKGYAKAADQTVKVKAGSTTTVTFEDYPKDDPIGIVLRKGDSELGTNKAQGKATLAGAVYEIKYYKHTDDGKKLDRTWRVVTNAKGIAHLSEDDLDPSFDNDEFYYSSAGDPCFPMGTVTVQEVKAPTGYVLNSKIYTTEIKPGSGTTESVSSYNIPKIGSDEEMAEDVKRGDLEFVKVADGTLERLAGVPFRITSLTTGESHIIVTDKNGYASTASSWNKHTYNTNRGKYSTDGIWFGEGAPDNSKGALIYDDYVIEEQPCDANKGMNLITVTVSIYKNNVTVPLGTLTDDQIEIGTTAKDEDTDSHIGQVQETVYIKDTVEYSGLKKGETYKLTGTLMNKETGKAITSGGKAVTAETTFTPKLTDGQVDVEFEVPGSAVRGKAVVVFEDLYFNDIKLASHADIDDEGQTVYYPNITTMAKDNETKAGVSRADSKVTLVDTVSYSGLMTGKKYTVIGTLMDKATGKPVMNGDEAVTASSEFTPKSMSGTVDVNFTFDGSSLDGKSVVVYETLKYHNREVAYHQDLADDGQTIYFPEIGTTAKDNETKIGVSNPDKSVTVVDTVSYEGLRPGLEYKVTGTLMDKASGEAVKVDGKAVTAAATFTPAKSKGTVDVTFKFNGKSLEGKSVVVFESLTYKGIELADHENLKDDGQTIYFPDIATTAKDSEFDDHISMADEDVTIVDTVSYEGLRPGIEYKVVGRLMNQETGEPVKVDGADVRAEAKFTPKSSAGNVDVTYNFTGVPLKGTTTVVFETLYYRDVELAAHTDLSDAEQTVYIPEIRTQAKDAETRVGVGRADDQITLSDTVTYTNLLPGKEYTVIGKLMDQSTENPVMNGDKEVTASAVFTAEKSSGKVEVTFVFAGENLKGKSVVVFETLQYKGKTVAVHEELEDGGQTVYFPEIKTTAKDSETEIGLGLADSQVTIVDTVSYEGLRPGLEYTVKGTLMDKSTGEPVKVDGKEVTAQSVFTPDKTKGTVDVTFKFNGKSLEGSTVVVFESLYYDEVELASHADLKDDGQTIYIPEIGTTAKDFEIDDHIGRADEDVTIVDTVKYTNLRPGLEYKVVGKLMNKATGEIIQVDGKVVTAESVFTAEAENGSVDVTFSFSGVNLKGETVVAFETLYHKDITVAIHAEIDDKMQTVYLPEIKTAARDSETKAGLSKADDEIILTDSVSYTDVMPGAEYTVIGVLMDKATGEPVVSAGRGVTAEAVFTALDVEGTVDIVFEFDGSDLAGKTVVVFESLRYKGKEVAFHTDLDDDKQTVYIPEIGTSAVDADTEIGVSRADDHVTIMDTVSYEGLRPGLEYKVVGTLVDKETGKPVQADGKDVTSEAVFTPDQSEGSIELAFDFNAEALRGTTVVVFENVYYNGVEVAVHADLNDDAQTVYLPDIATTARDSETMNHISMADEEITIVDTVDYTDLRSGVEYKVSGKLMNKETGDPVLVDDKEVVAETVFTPETPDGSVDITFVFDGVSLEGVTVVAFESLSYRDYELAVHADLEDVAQTVYIPEIGTSAVDSETGIGISKADEKITLVDTVSYTNLMPGAEYTVKGTLMDKVSGEPVLVEAKPMTAEAIFTAEAADGTVDVVFEFDGRSVAGKTTVVFESLVFEDKEVAVHADLTDDAQTVYIPEIGTSAKDFETDIAVSNPDSIVNIIDVVSYEGLRPGVEYKVSGVLMNKATGKPLMVDGKQVTAEEVFTPEASKGAVGMAFSFDGAGLEGQTVVAFESVNYNGIEVGVHADINDQAQSVSFPEIKTSAKDKTDGDQEIVAESKVTVVDTVAYQGFVAEETYTVKGILMDKETGKAVKVDGKEVTAEKTFVAKDSDGSVELEFKFNAEKLAGKKLVVFEKMYYRDVQIGAHEDINAKEQTVEVIELPSAPETGDKSNLLLWLAVCGLALVTGTLLVARKKRKADSSGAEEVFDE